jgi:hypothetical protein
MEGWFHPSQNRRIAKPTGPRPRSCRAALGARSSSNTPTKSGLGATLQRGCALPDVADDLQFREFFAGEYGRLRRLGFLLTGDWTQAEELAQDALVRVYWVWPRVRRLSHPGAYARRVLVNGTARCCGAP